MVTDYLYAKGKTSLNKWQVNAVVRNVLAHRLAVNHNDIQKIEAEILRKETGLPGTNQRGNNLSKSP